MSSVLFVCTANQTRSPIAAALFTPLLVCSGQFAGAGWRVESAGLRAQEGLPANWLVKRVLHARGLDYLLQPSQCVSEALLKGFDLILVMEKAHRGSQELWFDEMTDLPSCVYLFSEIFGVAGENLEDLLKRTPGVPRLRELLGSKGQREQGSAGAKETLR